MKKKKSIDINTSRPLFWVVIYIMSNRIISPPPVGGEIKSILRRWQTRIKSVVKLKTKPSQSQIERATRSSTRPRLSGLLYLSPRWRRRRRTTTWNGTLATSNKYSVTLCSPTRRLSNIYNDQMERRRRRRRCTKSPTPPVRHHRIPLLSSVTNWNPSNLFGLKLCLLHKYWSSSPQIAITYYSLTNSSQFKRHLYPSNISVLNPAV